MKTHVLIGLIFSAVFLPLNAQNCTVNAGVDRSYCFSDSITLQGFSAGLINGQARWYQTAGPSALINNPLNLVSAVRVFSPGTYIFLLRARCQDGSNADDQITVTVLPVTQANAGKGKNICDDADSLSANFPGVGEVGTWTYIQNQGKFNISALNNPVSPITVSQSNGGISIFRWTISNTNGCSSSDDVQWLSYGGKEPVSTMGSITLSACYSGTTGTGLYGSFSGRGLGGQQAQWTALSGPSVPVIVNANRDSASVSNLITGTYTFEYAVSGPCANGKDTLTVIVPAPLGALSPNFGRVYYYCDRPQTVFLTGSPPIYVNDTCGWRQISGPSTVTFSPVNSYATAVSGLRGKGLDQYQFSYTMANPITGCVSSSIHRLIYIDTPAITAFPDTVLSCNETACLLRFNDTGGLNTNIGQVSGPMLADLGTFQTDSLSKYFEVNDMLLSGSYLFRVRRNSGSGQACVSVEDFIRVIVSLQPGISNAGSSQVLNCTVDTTELAGNIPTAGQGNWWQNSGPNTATVDSADKHITKVRDLIAGKYQFRWLINGGQACIPEQDDVNIFVSDSLPNQALAGADQNICFGSILSLQGNLPNANCFGKWKALPDSGLVFSDSNSFVCHVSGMDSTITYQFVWKIYNSCGETTDTLSVDINSNVAPKPALAGSDLCLPDSTSSFRLNGNSPWLGEGLWTKISGPADSLENDTVYNTLVFPSGPGHYRYEWQISNGICTPGRDTVLITLSSPVSTAYAGKDIDTCANNVLLQAQKAVYGLGHWTLKTGRINGTISMPDSAHTPVINLAQGTYLFRWLVNNGACGSSFDDVKVNIANPITTPLADTGLVWCNPGSISIQANRISSGKGYWSLHGSNPSTAQFQSADSANTNVSGLVAGIYAFKWNAYNPMGICPNQYSLRYDTIVFPANAGPDMRLCRRSNVELKGTFGSRGYWRQYSGSAATVDTTGSNTAIINGMNSAGSPYRFIYEIFPSYACPNNSDTLTIDIQDSSVRAYAGIDLKYCNNDTFFMNANTVSPDTGFWSQSSGPNQGSFNQINSPNAYFINAGSGLYEFKWTSRNMSCVNSDFVLVSNFDSSITADAGNDTSICPPYVEMNANANGSNYAVWRQISGPTTAQIQSPINRQTRINNLSQGNYIFEWSIANGICPTSIDSVQIAVPFLQPGIADAGKDTSLCALDSLQMQASSIFLGSGTWTQISGNTVNIVDDTLFNTLLLNIDSGLHLFVWQIQNGNCIATDTVQITKNSPPSVPDAGRDSSYCLYDNVYLSSNLPQSGRGLWREISNGSAFIVSPDSSYTQVAALGAGQYQFEWTIESASCGSLKDTVQVQVDSIPTLSNAGPNQNICLAQTKMNGSKAISGLGTWTQLSGINNLQILNPQSDTSTINLLDSAVYSFEWKIAKGNCISRDTMEIRLRDPQSNDQCLQPTSIFDPGGIYYGDLCGAKTYGNEPATNGMNACNTIFYKFRTIGYNYSKSIQINILTMSQCTNGVRISLFDSGACPGLGLQHDSTVIAGMSSVVVFDSLAANQTYILVIDDNNSPCVKTSCNFSFELSGNALPVDLLHFEVKPLSGNKADIQWICTGDESIQAYEIWKTQAGQSARLGRVAAQNTWGIQTYHMQDPLVSVYPVTYVLKAVYANGHQVILASRTLWENKYAEDIQLFPNPASGKVNITSNSGLTIRGAVLKLYNQQGRLIKILEDIDITSLPYVLDIADCSEGVYHLLIENGDKYVSRTLIIGPN